MRLFPLVGILGGFTTFSSYAFESAALIHGGEVLWAAINIAGQVAIGVAGMAAGMAMMR